MIQNTAFDIMEERRKAKMRSEDRILVLKPINDSPKASSGMVDTRLFKGENKLHAILDTRTNLWGLKYEMGGLPEPLRDRYTSFSRLLSHCKEYFGKRDVEIVQVID